MKKVYKYFITILIFTFIILSLYMINYSVYGYDYTQIYTGGSAKIDNLSSNALGIVQAIGYSVAVITVVAAGITYLFATPDGQAKVKDKAILFLIGSVILFSLTTVVSFFSRIGYSFN